MFGHGRISYIQIPALDVQASGAFYAKALGWEVRGDGTETAHLGFTDATGDFIGAWVTGRAISTEPGVIPYIYVHGIDAALQRIKESGGEVVSAPFAEGELWVATFRDPAGNVIGVWQAGPREAG